MDVVCLTFTFPEDAAKAALCGAFVPTGWTRVWCVESGHAGMPVPPGVIKLVADFPRGGTLRGKPALLGISKVFADFAPVCDCLVKLDSDTALWRPEAFVAPVVCGDVDFVYIRREKNEGGYANGNAYALSQRALGRMANFGTLADSELIDRYRGHEDRVFSAYLIDQNPDLTGCQIDKKKCHWHMRNYKENDCIASHYGYISFEEARSGITAMCEKLNRDAPEITEYLENLNDWVCHENLH